MRHVSDATATATDADVAEWMVASAPLGELSSALADRRSEHAVPGFRRTPPARPSIDVRQRPICSVVPLPLCNRSPDNSGSRIRSSGLAKEEK